MKHIYVVGQKRARNGRKTAILSVTNFGDQSLYYMPVNQSLLAVMEVDKSKKIKIQGVLAFHDFTIHDPRKFMIFFKHQFREFLANS